MSLIIRLETNDVLAKLGPSLLLTWSDISCLECFYRSMEVQGKQEIRKRFKREISSFTEGLGGGLEKAGELENEKGLCVAPGKGHFRIR